MGNLKWNIACKVCHTQYLLEILTKEKDIYLRKYCLCEELTCPIYKSKYCFCDIIHKKGKCGCTLMFRRNKTIIVMIAKEIYAQYAQGTLNIIKE